MTVPAAAGGVSTEAWLDALAHADALVEVVNGELVVKRVGGNPHHYIARRLAEEFERQWAGVVATAPGNWTLVAAADGRIMRGRMPDVLVDDDALLSDAVFSGVPEAVVEVWSPRNTLEEMNDKRRKYRMAGLPVFVEVFLNEAGDVHLEWLVRAGERWETLSAAVGDTPLTVERPRAFHVVPNSLLRVRSPSP